MTTKKEKEAICFAANSIGFSELDVVTAKKSPSIGFAHGKRSLLAGVYDGRLVAEIRMELGQCRQRSRVADAFHSNFCEYMASRI